MKKELNVQIGVRVRIARERMHLSREQLSELLDISSLFLSYIECGQKGMSLETLSAICRTLNTSADYILLGQDKTDASASEAQQLLEQLPECYLDLAAEYLRMMIKTIATTHNQISSTPEPRRGKVRSRNNKVSALYKSTSEIEDVGNIQPMQMNPPTAKTRSATVVDEHSLRSTATDKKE